jgi:uncharacterized protein YbjT (DUF2867 family)
VRVAVAGAAGNVGSELVRQLCAEGIAVRAVSRRPRPSTYPLLEWAVGDLAVPETIVSSFTGCDAVFLPATGHEEALLAGALRAGVRRVVLMSTIAVLSRPRTAIGSDHRRAERAVAASELEWTILRSGHYASNAKEWVAQIVAEGRVTGRKPDVALPVIAPSDVAAVATRALADGGLRNRSPHLTGPIAISERERVNTLARLLGHEIAYHRTDFVTVAPQAREIVDIRDNPIPLEQAVTSAVREITGRDPVSFEEWARANLDVFRSAVICSGAS